MPTSFIRSTIDFFQSSFSGLLAASPSRTAVTSTDGGGAAATPGGFPWGGGGAAMPGGLPTGGGGAAIAGGLPGAASLFWAEGAEEVCALEVEAAGAAPPKILDINVLNSFMAPEEWQLGCHPAT